MVTSNHHACNATNSPTQNRTHHLGGKQDGALFDLSHVGSFPASFGSGHQPGIPGSRFALTNPARFAIGVHGNSRSALRQTGMRDTFPNAPLWSLLGHSPHSWITILRAVILKPLSVRAGSTHSPHRPGFAFAIRLILSQIPIHHRRAVFSPRNSCRLLGKTLPNGKKID